MPEAGGAFSVLRIPVSAPRRGDFVEAFTALGIFERASGDNGMLSARLLEPARDGDELVVLAEWPSAAAYQGWLDNPLRARVNERLAAFVDGEMTGGVFVVAHAFEAGRDR